MNGTTYVIIRLRSRVDGAWFVDPELRDRLRADAVEKGTSITDVALSILAKKVKVPYVASGRVSEPQDVADNLTVRIPAPIYDAVRKLSPTARGMQDVMRETLCSYYGLRVPEKPKRTRGATAAA